MGEDYYHRAMLKRSFDRYPDYSHAQLAQMNMNESLLRERRFAAESQLRDSVLRAAKPPRGPVLLPDEMSCPIEEQAKLSPVESGKALNPESASYENKKDTHEMKQDEKKESEEPESKKAEL